MEKNECEGIVSKIVMDGKVCVKSLTLYLTIIIHFNFLFSL